MKNKTVFIFLSLLNAITNPSEKSKECLYARTDANRQCVSLVNRDSWKDYSGGRNWNSSTSFTRAETIKELQEQQNKILKHCKCGSDDSQIVQIGRFITLLRFNIAEASNNS